MDSRFEIPLAATEFDSANATASTSASIAANEPRPQSQASLVELNSVLLIVMGGLAAILAAGAFLLSVH